MIYSIFFIAVIATITGAIAPGASNLAVIKTTLQENIHESLKISYGAGIGEVLLALGALSFGMALENFIQMHIWTQVIVLIALAIAGIYFIKNKKETKKLCKGLRSKYLTGFVLGVINPPVLLYWVLVFSLLKSNADFMLDTPILMLLIAGIFLGKVVTLYGYGKLGTHIATKKSKVATKINPIIGTVLLSLAFLQGVKLLLF